MPRTSCEWRRQVLLLGRGSGWHVPAVPTPAPALSPRLHLGFTRGKTKVPCILASIFF